MFNQLFKTPIYIRIRIMCNYKSYLLDDAWTIALNVIFIIFIQMHILQWEIKFMFGGRSKFALVYARTQYAQLYAMIMTTLINSHIPKKFA